MAENALSFTLALKIIELSQTLIRDQATLSTLSMSRTTVSYKLKYGISKTIKDHLINILKNTPFSLNVDESISNAGESIFTTLVQFFEDNQKEVIIHHLASHKLELSSAFSLYSAIIDNIKKKEIQ